MFELKQAQNTLQYPNQLISLKTEAEIESSGNYSWHKTPEKPDGDWLYLDAMLLPLFGGFFLYVRAYEHSRGANVIEMVNLFDLTGKQYWEQTLLGYNFDKCLVNEQNGVFVLRNTYPEDRPYAYFKGYTGTDIVIFNLEDCREISRYHLCYPVESLKEESRLALKELLDQINWNGLSSVFEQREDKTGILIKLSDFAKSKIQGIEPVFTEFGEFLKKAPQKADPGMAPPA